MEQNTSNQIVNNSNTEEKTFTQEDVNRIIGERLAKEKNKGDTAFAEREAEFAARERELANREALFNLKDQLKEMNLPEELLPVLNVSDKKALDTALEALKTYIADQIQNDKKSKKVLVNKLPTGEYDTEDPIGSKLRKAMHLTK